jgi:hypothetical protein
MIHNHAFIECLPEKTVLSDKYCHQCKDWYCLPCFLHIHKKGNKSKHKWTDSFCSSPAEPLVCVTLSPSEEALFNLKMNMNREITEIVDKHVKKVKKVQNYKNSMFFASTDLNSIPSVPAAERAKVKQE